jgi:hypothetical protein
MRLHKGEVVDLGKKGGARVGLPKPVAVLPWDVNWDYVLTDVSQEAPAHPGDLSWARPKPFMGVALQPIGFVASGNIFIILLLEVRPTYLDEAMSALAQVFAFFCEFFTSSAPAARTQYPRWKPYAQP